jgi:hypothetical protein
MDKSTHTRAYSPATYSHGPELLILVEFGIVFPLPANAERRRRRRRSMYQENCGLGRDIERSFHRHLVGHSSPVPVDQPHD